MAVPVLSVLMWASGPAAAQPLPLVNLGITSFMDGGTEASGWTVRQFFLYASADRFNDHRGDEIAGFPDLEAAALATLIGYSSDKPLLLGGRLGWTTVVVTVFEDLTLDADGSGVGDLFVGPSLQWDPIVIDQRPVFVHRLEFDMILPVGRYDSDRATNPGSNAISINPYWAATWFINERWELSWRLHYLWNDENDDPPKPRFPGAETTQAGQAFHMNFASSFALTRQFRVGVAGYYLKQFTDAKINGQPVPNSREEVFAIGPGVAYQFSPTAVLIFNTYFDVFSENRPQGAQLVASFLVSF